MLKVDFKLYNDQQQLYALETEFILGALLNQDPDTVFKLYTWRDLLTIKEKARHFKTKANRIQFLQKCQKELEHHPFNSIELQKIRSFINKQN